MTSASRLRPLQLRPLGTMEEVPLGWLAAELEARLPVHTHLCEPWPLRAEWLDPERGQYRSNAIVDALVATGPEGWMLAVTEVDLFAPGHRFVFGEATLGGCCALVSLARLRDDVGSEPAPRLRHRLLVEAIHEIGHVAGLAHCDIEGCVMMPSAQAADIDAKSPDFCARCVARVQPFGS